MDSEKDNTTGNTEEPKAENLNALDALSSKSETTAADTAPPPPKKKGFRRLLDIFNVYLLIFLLLIVIAGIVFVVSYLNSQKEPELPETAIQELTQETLSEIASGDASVGDPKYVLNIQSDAVFAGNALIRGDLSVAGNIQLGNALSIPALTVSGASNLSQVQANTLAVASTLVVQGAVTMQNDLTVSGSSNFNGSLTAGSITTSNLTLGGAGNLTLNNHLVANGPNPGRTYGNALGGGGSASVSGSDTAGTVNINTGNSPSAGCFVTINFVQNFNGTPHVQITPITPAAAQIPYYVTRNSNGFSICTASSTPGGRTLSFDYWVVN